MLSSEDSNKCVYDTEVETKIHGSVAVNLYGWVLFSLDFVMLIILAKSFKCVICYAISSSTVNLHFDTYFIIF